MSREEKKNSETNRRSNDVEELGSMSDVKKQC